MTKVVTVANGLKDLSTNLVSLHMKLHEYDDDEDSEHLVGILPLLQQFEAVLHRHRLPLAPDLKILAVCMGGKKFATRWGHSAFEFLC